MTLVSLLLYFLDHLYKLSESCHHLNRPCVNTVLQPDKNMLEVLPPPGIAQNSGSCAEVVSVVSKKKKQLLVISSEAH